MTIPQKQFRANDPRHFGPIKTDTAASVGKTGPSIPPEFSKGGMQIGAVFSPIAVVPFGFTAIKQGTMTADDIDAAEAAGKVAYRCLATVSTDDVGGPFTWQGFSLHLKSPSVGGNSAEFVANRAAERTPVGWGDGLGEQAAIVMAPAHLLPDELSRAERGSWTVAPSVAPWLTYASNAGGEMVFGGKVRTMIAQAFPIGNYDDPTKTRELIMSERENPLSERILEGESVKVFFATRPVSAYAEEALRFLHGFCNGRLILSTQRASGTVS